MIRSLARSVLLISALTASSALSPLRALALPEPAIVSSVAPAPDPLTTARLRAIDPNELNPHRRNWGVERKLGLKGLAPVAREGGVYSAQAAAVETEALFHVRGDGPWYQPLALFACGGAKKTPWFATQAGARKAAEVAAQHWVDTLAREKPKLSLRLSRIAAPSGVRAMAKAAQVYQSWLEQTETLWRQGAYDRARKAELALYQQEASRIDVDCRTVAPGADRMRERMEVVSEAPVRKLLVRAPSRRWGGAFTVRLSLEIGTHSLNGAFLIDSTAPRSIVSPAWLLEQGIPEAYVELPDAAVERAVHFANPTGGIARRAGFDRVTMSGFQLPLHEFLLYDTALFDVPGAVAPCCAGILGNDFLRRYAVEFDPGFPAAVQLYDPLNYSEGGDSDSDATGAAAGLAAAKGGARWEEISFYGSDAIASPCRASAAAGSGAKTVTPIRWSFAAPSAFRAPAAPQGSLDLSCGGSKIASGFASSGKAPVLATAGNPLLSKGPVTLDLPNGRIWFSKKMREASITRNETGLQLEYVLRKAARVLVVRSIRPRSPAAQAFGKAGLKPGMTIEQVDGIEADEIDGWQLERRLAGDYGKTVSLGWSTPKGQVSASLEVGAPVPASQPAKSGKAAGKS